MLFRVFLFLISICASVASAGPLDYLNQIQPIRFLIVDAPNSGHQATAATVISRMRSLGYAGAIEVVYQKSAKQKLGYLFDGFDVRGADEQSLAPANLTFETLENFNSNSRSHVRLAMIAAQDSAGGYTHAQDLGADLLLRLQPEAWGDGTQALELQNGKIISLEHLKDLPHQLQLEEPADAADFISKQLAGDQNGMVKADILTKVVSRNDIEILSAYGFQDWIPVPKIFRLSMGITRAQNESPQSFKGGTVVLLMSSLSDFQRQNTLKLLELGRAHLTKDATRVKFMKITDSALPQALAEIRTDQTLFIECGPLPQNLFSFLLERSTMPATISGKHSRTTMRQIGKPFLDTEFSDWIGKGRFYGLKDRKASIAKTKELASRAWFELNDRGPEATPLSSESGRAIASFLIAAKDPSSGVAQTYASLKELEADRGDKVSAVFEEIKPLLLPSQKPRPALDCRTLGDL